jgi:hypothetical protein
VRVRPHLVTTVSEIDDAVAVFDSVLSELAS